MAKKKTQGWLDAYDDEMQLGGYVYPTNYVPQAQHGIDKTFINQWTNSPMHLAMLKKSSPNDYESILQGRKENIAKTKIKYKPEDMPYVEGSSNPSTGEVTIFTKDPNMQQGLTTHEMSHSSDMPIQDLGWRWKNFKYNLGIDKELVYDRAIPESDIALINKYRPYNFEGLPDKKEIQKEMASIKPKLTNEDKEGQYLIRNVDYKAEPTETRARLNDLRQRAFQSKIYNPFKEKINAQQFKKLLDSSEIRKGTDPLYDLKSIYTNEEIIDMLNSISKNKNNKVIDTAENGIEGTMGGLTDKGFNYNGAWGGPSMQNGGLTFLEPTSRKLPMGYAPPYRYPSTELAVSIGGEGDEPAYLIPSFKGGKRVNDPDAEFRRTGEHLGGPFKTWQEADEWERTVRHPYVEKGQNIPTPFRRWGKDFAMGGSLPGSVGFTYARTGGIPSNGPYAKKTMASAQDGEEITPIQFYNDYLNSPNYINRLKLQGYKDPKKTISDRLNNLNKTKVTNVKGLGNIYRPDRNNINLDSEEQKEYNLHPLSTKVHEYSHAAGSLGHYLTPPEKIKNTTLNRKEINLIDRGNKFWNLDTDDRKKYSIDKAAEIEHDRVASEVKADMDVLRYNLKKDKIYDTGTQNFNQEYLNKSKNKYKNNKVINRLFDRYSDKDLINLMNTIAKTDDDDLSFAQNGMEMKFYQEGLDWTPKNISRDGSEIPQAQLGTHMLTPDFGQVGENIMEMLSVPQKALTKLFSGKYQTPSEALGIKNKVGAFVTNVALDPLSWVGGGEVANIIKGTSKAAKVSNALENVTTRGQINLERTAAKPKRLPKPSMDEVDLGNDLVLYNNPSRVRNPESILGKQQEVKTIKNSKTGEYVSLKSWQDDVGNIKYYFSANMPSSKLKAGKAYLELEKHIPKGSTIMEPPNSSLSLDSYTNAIKQTKNPKFESSVKDYISLNHSSVTNKLKNKADADFGNYTSSESAQAGANEINQLLKKYNLPEAKIVADESYRIRVNDELTPTYQIKLPNIALKKLYTLLGVTAGAEAIDKKKKGGKVKKDDNGYWNPDNWGEPVEIGSNEITMEGVYEPLLGISDTGDTQMMYPGEDYTFDGESVTEYPIKKNGGWLEKYK